MHANECGKSSDLDYILNFFLFFSLRLTVHLLLPSSPNPYKKNFKNYHKTLQTSFFSKGKIDPP